MKWRGDVVDPASARLPITFIHQDLGLVDSMTVAENVALLAGYPRQRSAHRVASGRRGGAGGARTSWTATSIRDVRVGSLSAAEKSIVAIARALARKSDILVLDEPTAALPAADVDLLLDKLLRLKASGIGLLYVTHRLDEVFRIADRVTVLRDGRRVAARPISEHEAEPTSSNGSSAERSRRRISRRQRRRRRRSSMSTGLVVPQEDGAGIAGPVSFAVHRGETLGLVGLRGAGHHAVGRALFGALPARSGRISFERREVALGNPAAAMDAGIGFVSSRRGEESLAGKLTALENLYVNARARRVPPFRLVGRRGNSRRAPRPWPGFPCGRPIRRASSRPSAAATSRRSWWRAGWSPTWTC